MLVKSVNGSEDILNEMEYNFALIDENNPGTYKISIQYNMQDIKITMQKDPSLEHVTLFDLENYDIRRGCVGIAKKGNIKASIT